MNNSTIVLREENLKLSDWKIKTYPHYFDFINSCDESDLSQLHNYIEYALAHPKRASFRVNLQIRNVQFSAAIYNNEKRVLVASKQLGMELTLLEDDDTEKFSEIKEHANLIASIPMSSTPTQIELISHFNRLTLFNEGKDEHLFEKTNLLTSELVDKVNEYKQTQFEKLSDFGLDMTANYQLVRVHLLKFLAILPCLDHDKQGTEVKRIFLEALKRLVIDSNKAMSSGEKGQGRALPKHYIKVVVVALFICKYIPAIILAKLIRKSVAVLAKRFIAGENIFTARKALEQLMNSGRDATIDQLGELVLSEAEADEYLAKVLEIIAGLSSQIPLGSRNSAGILSAHVSIKITALINNFIPQDFEYCYKAIAPRLKKILIAAKNAQVFINIDAEHYHYRDAVFNIYKKVLLESDELKSFADTGIVVQAYLRDGINHFNDVLSLAKERNILMPIRLVKGAYWDSETIEASAHNYPAPQFLNKEETDIHFRQIANSALAASEHIQLAIASHNIQDHCFCEVLRTELYPKAPVIEHQCLHMTYEALSVGLAKMGYATRNYIPVGDLLVGMAYLVRRIMENSSQVGVLTIMRSHKKAMNLKHPSEILKEKVDNISVTYDEDTSIMSSAFKNIYPIRTYLESERLIVENAINRNHKVYQVLNESNLTEGSIASFSNSFPELMIGSYKKDSVSTVNKKIDDLFDGFNQDWSRNLGLRVRCLFRLADQLLFKREELTSLIVFEAGKTVDEAIADVDEAIDFIHFYIREQIRLTKSDKLCAKGVVGVIAPWNFPLAIPCGMSVAALVAGNSVILKPAEQTPLIALEFYRLAIEAGIPSTVFSIVIGEGDIGKAIVDHKLINGVVFTGSKSVGTEIYNKLTPLMSDDLYLDFKIPKFAITEMGGKNAIIITNNCELDETVDGVIHSAFAHAGQKCSAASRIIIDKEIKEAFIKRFKKAVEDLNIGTALNFSTLLNPLATKSDQDRVRAMALTAKEEVMKYGGDVIVDLSQNTYPGYCVGPSVFELDAATVLANETIASTEVFGPLVHLIAYDNLDHAIEIFNSTEYALTGGIFGQSQDDIDYLKSKLMAGNLYINRPCTGARVGIEPFGGFRMSGTGPKAGGVDYLKRFNHRLSSVIDMDVPDILVKEKQINFRAAHSQLSYSMRKLNTLKFLEQVNFQYSEIFETIDEVNKNKLKDLAKYIGRDYFNLAEREFPNKLIPGQLSYSIRDMNIGNGLFIVGTKQIVIEELFGFAINLLLGNGVTITCSNQNNYEKWHALSVLAKKCGFSYRNLSINLMDEETLLDFSKTHDFDFVVYSFGQLSIKIKQALIKSNQVGLTRFYYTQELNYYGDFIESLSHCRAFAVNTMRHGAPLELS